MVEPPVALNVLVAAYPTNVSLAVELIVIVPAAIPVFPLPLAKVSVVAIITADDKAAVDPMAIVLVNKAP